MLKEVVGGGFSQTKIRLEILCDRSSQPSIRQSFHGEDLMQTTTSGLLAGVRVRQVAERSFEYSAGFLPGPQ
jgi:hypothetical protein